MVTSAHPYAPVSSTVVVRQRRFRSFAVLIALAVFVTVLVGLEIGRQVGLHQLSIHGAQSRAGIGVIDGAAAALLALLIGFFFSGANSRYDHRRNLVAKEVTSVATAWQRIETLPAQRAAEVRAGFRRYLDELIDSYVGGRNVTDPLLEPPSMSAARTELWQGSVAACLGQGGEPARMLLLPSLNEMFVAVESERLARRIHPPLIIYAMLGFSLIGTALFSGYATAQGPRNWMFIVGTAATIAIALYVIIELEYPRLGMLGVDALDQALVDLRASMN